MARKKSIKRAKPVVEKEYFEWVKVTDPVTGKKKKTKVKIIKYKTKHTSVDSDENKDEFIESINSRVRQI